MKNAAHSHIFHLTSDIIHLTSDIFHLLCKAECGVANSSHILLLIFCLLSYCVFVNLCPHLIGEFVAIGETNYAVQKTVVWRDFWREPLRDAECHGAVDVLDAGERALG